MKQLFLITFLLNVFILSAQYDTLLFTNGTKKAVIITGIGKKNIKYKIPANLNGPSFVVPVKMIEKYTLSPTNSDITKLSYNDSPKKKNYIKDSLNNIIFSPDLLQLSIKHLQFNLEVITKRRKLGLEVYYNYGFSDRTLKANYDRKEVTMNPVENGFGYYKFNYGGFNLKIYPIRQKKLTYYIAFGAETGLASCVLAKTYSYLEYTPNGWGWTTQIKSTTTTVYRETNYYNYHFNTGPVLRLNNRFVFQLNATTGINQFKRITGNSSDPKSYDYSFKYGLGFFAGIAF